MDMLFGNLTYSADAILGKKPGYGWESVSSIPNKQAVGIKIWVPGLDEGYIPQGVTFAEGQILISLYQSKDEKISKGPGRAYRVAPATGNITGQFELPSDVGHADGLAYAGNNVLYLADTASAGKVYKLDLEKAIKKGNSEEAILGKILVGKGMGPAFLTYDGKNLWFGQYSKSGKPKIFKVDPDSVFQEWPKINKVSPDLALMSFEIDTETQGATFDRDGFLWLSRSGSKMGKLQKVDASSGKVLKEYEVMPGIEDLAFSPDGKLWSVSEAGSMRWFKWATYYPLIFEIDINKLK